MTVGDGNKEDAAMSQKTTTAGWLKEFAEEAERDLDWHQEFETRQDGVWEKPGSKEALLYYAVNWPMSIRRKPRRITISGPGGEYSYPEPVREAPRNGARYFVPLLKQEGVPFSFTWGNCTADYAHLRRGSVHLDEDSAREHAEAKVRAAGFEP